jgi:hypothetical protein
MVALYQNYMSGGARGVLYTQMDALSAHATFASLALAMDEIHNRNTSTLSSEELVPQRVQPGTAQAPQSIVRGGYQLIIPTYIYVMVALYQNMVA